MALPDFIVIGAPKAATTTLCHRLALHDAVHFLAAKESHFFNYNYDRGIAWYEALFGQPRPGLMVGEGTPDYAQGTHAAVTAERMFRHVPEARLIYLLREPVARIESHYHQMIANGKAPLPFGQAVVEWADLLETSCYHARLQDFLRWYPSEQVLVLFHDDLARDPASVMARCLDFLGLDAAPDVLGDDSVRNARGSKAVDGAFLQRLRQRPWFETVRHRVPRGWIERCKPLLTRGIDAARYPVAWTGPAISHVLPRLEADLEMLRGQVEMSHIDWDPRARLEAPVHAVAGAAR